MQRAAPPSVSPYETPDRARAIVRRYASVRRSWRAADLPARVGHRADGLPRHPSLAMVVL